MSQPNYCLAAGLELSPATALQLRKREMGLWMIQSIRRELNGVEYVAGKASRYASGKTWPFPDLIAAAQGASDFSSAADANDAAFLAPLSAI